MQKLLVIAVGASMIIGLGLESARAAKTRGQCVKVCTRTCAVAKGEGAWKCWIVNGEKMKRCIGRCPKQ